MPLTSQEPSPSSWRSLCSERLRSFLGLLALSSSSSASLAQGQTELCLGCVMVGLGVGAESTHTKSLSWGPADWTGVPGLLQVEGQLAQRLVC